jgi:hypothetical protein
VAFGAADGPAILVRFLADTKGLADGVNKVEGAGSKLKGFGKAVGGAFATAGILAFGKSAVSAAEESAVASARLGNVFAKTGDQTGEAAKAAEKYAGELMKKTAIDDELIMGAQAQLAAFKDVSNATARGAGIFDRATAAAADLAAAGFGELEGNAKTLGKALSDPIKATGKLAKAGVVLTAAQKDQIKALVESGDKLGAQKLLLAEVEKRVGGTAAATATSSEKMKVAFGEVQEKVGAKLLPVLKLVADMFAKYADLLIPIGAALAAIVVATKLYSAATKAATLVTKLVAAAQWLWNAALTANPIGLVVLAVVALGAAVFLAYKKVGWFRDGVQALGRLAVAVFGHIVDAVKAVFVWVKDHWPLLLAILTGPIGLAVLAITKNWDTIKNAGVTAFEAVKHAASVVWDFLKALPGKIVTAFAGLARAISEPYLAAFRAIANAWNRGPGALSFTVPSWIPKLGGKGFDVPDIPSLASGGVTTSAGLAFLHPAEVVTPLARAGVGGNTYAISVAVPPTSSPAAVGRAIVDAIRSYESVSGTSWRMSPTGRA